MIRPLRREHGVRSTDGDAYAQVVDRCARAPPRRVATQVADGARVVGVLEDGAAGDDDVGARLDDGGDVVDLDAAVDLDVDVEPAAHDLGAQLANLGQRRWG